MEELNKQREKASLTNIISIVCIVLAFLSFMIMPAIGILFFIIGAILLFVSSMFAKEYTKNYKSSIVQSVLNEMFEIEEYDPIHGFSEEFVNSTYLISKGNRFSSDDYIKARYHNITFERSDVHMQNVQSTGKSTTVVTYFQGSWNVFTFPKKIFSYLAIKEKEFLNNGKPGGIFSNAPKTTKVLFEDIDFNERFVVFAQDEHDAFYILTPHFIEKIKEVERLESGRLIIGIIDSKIHVLYDNHKNLLNPSIWNVVSEDDYNIIRNEMKLVIKIIETLNLQGE